MSTRRLTPYWPLWFIASMIWLAPAPAAVRLRRLVLAFAISVAAGYDDGIGYPLHASRTPTSRPSCSAILTAPSSSRWPVGTKRLALLFAAAMALVTLWVDERASTRRR